ncbi:unnamed protein product, partial [marine sediment metagenome]
DEYEALRALIGSERESEGAIEEAREADKPKRKPTAANRAYSKAFKKLKSKYMKKSGQVMRSRTWRGICIGCDNKVNDAVVRVLKLRPAVCPPFQWPVKE